jgi:4-amino-4-deoxy-L-arabinose transferase-like glycosyltransferase
MTVLDPPRPASEAPPVPDFRAAPAAARRSLVERAWRGPEPDPAWARPALLALLAATAVLYVWGLGASGWANSYYSAAVQAGTKSWKAFFFGSTDSSNFITVDKTPASLWVMELSARIFGVNAWSILVPQALEGVAAVGILFATVKRWFAPGAALAAGAVFALTPVAALMFRFNNPDALLVLCLVASAYAMTRALEHGRLRWLVAAGVLVGLAFLAKELQALLVLPGFGLVYLIAGPPRLSRRVGHVLALGCATIAGAGWWVAIAQLWPASSRPYFGGSQNNSFWNVLFGYNGFGRLTGDESGSVGGGPGATGRWGPTGWLRMFNPSFGGQISWLLPAALLLLVAGLAITARRSRTDRTRAALVLWGSWLLVTGTAFSLGQGIIHEYYTVALAPAIGALVGIGGALVWQRRDAMWARLLFGATVAVTGWWSYMLLHRSPTWFPWLRVLVLAAGLFLGIGIAVAPARRGRVAAAVAIGAVAVGVTAPAAYTLSTVKSPHTGAIPTAGPAVARIGFGGPGGGNPAGGPRGNAVGGFPNGFFNGGAAPGGAVPNFRGPAAGTGGGFPGGGRAGFPGGGAGRGGIGGLLNGSQPGEAITALLQESTGYRWTAATVGANNAAGYQLASGQAIMAIGGFNGTDPTPTLAQFQAYVRANTIHYFIAGGGGFGGGPGGSSGTSSELARWVESNFTAQTVDGVTVYDLSTAR